CMSITLSLHFSLNDPLSLAPYSIGTFRKRPVESLIRPIRLEKKGLASGRPALLNRSLFSRKNCLRSGNLNSNRVRLIICWSTSTCEKSGLTVRSKFNDGVIPTLASNPACKSEEFFAGSASLSLDALPAAYGITEILAPAGGTGSSQISLPEKANIPVEN